MEKKKQRPDNFGREVTIKGLFIVGMVVVMLIPQIIMQEKVRERENRKNEAVSEISSRWSHSQTVCGPVLTVPFVKQVKNSEGKLETVSTYYTFTPETLDIKTAIKPEVRKLGMYEAILYMSDLELSGSFGAVDAAAPDAGTPDLSKAYLTMEVSDVRGLSNELVFTFDGAGYPAESGGSREEYANSGYYSAKQLVVKPHLETLSEPMEFTCRLELKGSDGLYFIPIGRATSVRLSGEWTHPSFTGSFSPEHNVGSVKNQEDFTASWSVFHYNRDIPDMWEGEPRSFSHTAFGVALLSGANEYQQNERALKYAMLFVVLTFVVFFFVELLTYKRIHPIQYLLVGAALLIFYTLLLSISEIVGFGWAYLISAVATVGLITLYSASVFKSRRQTLLLSLILAFLYAYLYFILQLENYTLLVGSIGMFLILSVIMFVSRKINWYRGDAPAEK